MSRPARERAFPSFALLIAAFLTLVTALVVWGWSFYTTPVSERYLHPQYPLLKSSGPIGLVLGALGLVMMFLSVAFVVAKRVKVLRPIASPARFLQLHIFFGFAGPVLVTLHTGGKVGGLVSIAFWAMWSMVLSGIAGRYIYSKLPRTIHGTEMSLQEMEAELQRMVECLRSTSRAESLLGTVQTFLGGTRRAKGGLLSTLVRLLRDDLELPLTVCRVWRISGVDAGLSTRRRIEMTRLVLRQQRLRSRLAVYERTQRIFSYWHVFHRPFIAVTLVLVFLHVGTVVYLGYGLPW